MRDYATFDCETDPFLFGRLPKPFLWGFYDGKEFKSFDKTEDFVAFIKEYEGIAYAHNGGKFDFHYLFDHVDPAQRIMVINGRIAKIKIGKCELRDSYLLLPVPLNAFQKDDIDYALFEEDTRGDHMPEIISYLMGDCKYLYDLLSVQFQDYGQKLTLAGSAFEFYYSNFSNLEKPKTTQLFFEQFDQFYYGGRVECFYKGIIDHPFKVYDINSAYPYAMTFDHPYGSSYKMTRKLPDHGFENCFIDFIGKSDGFLPLREKGKLYFPHSGHATRFFATGHELKLGLDRGGIEIEKINAVYTFERTINFKDYVDHFFTAKARYKDTDKARYLLAKLYMNSLYGKYAQSGIDHKNYTIIEQQYIKAWQEEYEDAQFEGELGPYALMGEPIPETQRTFYNVATAASITGFVRAYLYEQILKSDTPLYCDTDCIVSKGGEFDTGKALGQWSLEGDFDRGAIAGKKMYAFRYKKVAKMPHEFKISSKGVKLNEKEIFSIAQGKEVIYKNNAPTFSIHKPPEFLARKIRIT